MDGSAFKGLGTALTVFVIFTFLVGGGCGYLIAKAAEHMPKIHVVVEEKK